MKVDVLTEDVVFFELSANEHRQVSKTMCDLMSYLEPTGIEAALMCDAETAYEFVYSVYMSEAQARLDGITWLPTAECADSLAVSFGAHPSFSIKFTQQGSVWRLSPEQLRFVELCIYARSRVATSRVMAAA